ncbi:5-deoxy-glucuronate isomerase [Minicystis rosea]|nr:5-deoxy-glucuronate isomerase [Minicystis rosea]
MTHSHELALDLSVHDLSAGQPLTLLPDTRERVVVISSGRCSARFLESDRSFADLGQRADVFDGPATAVYAPRGQTCQIEAAAGGAQIVVVSADAAREREPYVVRPKDVHIEHRGRGVWAREVHDIIGPDQPADRILLGETFSVDGVWSGYPPHKHDRHDPPHESRLDELFFIQVRPRSGFGVLIHYPATAEREQATVVRDGDIISVSEGFHSFVAAGGHRFYYLWALAGEGRALRMTTDPRHAWLSSAPAGTVPT